MYKYIIFFSLLAGQAYSKFWNYSSSTLNVYLSNDVFNSTLITPENIYFINPRMKVVIWVHGWETNSTMPSIQPLEDAILARRVNFIKIDWGPDARRFYPIAAYHACSVGENLGHFVSDLYVLGYKLEDIHLIGFSLGSHVCGKAGDTVFRNLLRKVGRITGLEPAGPFFDDIFNRQIGCSLSKNSARFVDVLHTNAGYAGSSQDIGTVNFYANCGRIQPGCGIDFHNLSWESILLNNTLLCSHVRAIYFFYESVVTNNIIAGREKDWYNPGCIPHVRFGYDVDTMVAGVYYFKTASTYPFSLGREGSCQNCDMY